MKTLYLQDYIAALPQEIVTKTPTANPPITSVTNDSRMVQPGSLFIAIKGARMDGHVYLEDVVQKGAVALIISSAYQGNVPDVPCIYVNDSYFAWASVCECHAGYPAKSFRLHTITGTNGKTSTAYFLRHLLSNIPSRKVGLISTVCTDTCGRVFPSLNTTPDSALTQEIFLEMQHNNVTDVVMESSSHGLHQHRTGHALFRTAAFTNLTGDHLDYHGDMEHYYQAKKILFSEMLAPDGAAIINLDDEYGRRLHEECRAEGIKRLYGFSLQDNPDAFCRIRANLAIGGSHFKCILDDRELQFILPLTGEFNLKNAITAMLMAYADGISPDIIQKYIICMPQVPGRLQHIPLANGAHAYVDYAHTDDALRSVLNVLRKMCAKNSKIITVFGCGGDRDKTKRPRMGAVVQRMSDIAIITDDNPRTESSDAIIHDILTGMTQNNSVHVVPNRAEAIAYGVSLAQEGDILLVAGKGHEDYQEINGTRIHFSDCETLQPFARTNW